MKKTLCALLVPVLCAGVAWADHPQLFFKAEDLPALRERAQSTHGRYVEAVRTLFEWDRQSAPALPEAGKPIDEGTTNSWMGRLVNASLLWAATADTAVFEQARKWLTGLCDASATGDFNYGWYALGLAVGYDVLHDNLSAGERERVRQQLASVCQGLYQAGTARGGRWWRQIYLHHDHWVPTAGMGIGALALKDEDERWEAWYELASRELTLALSLAGDDGGWHEGVAGWCYGMSAMLPFVEASRNVAGDDLYRFPWLRNCASARLYFRLPDGSYVFYGDSFREGRYHGPGSTPAHHLRLLAARYRDGHAQWLAEQEEARDLAALASIRSEQKPGSPPPNASRLSAFYSAGWSLVWSDLSVKAVPPDDLATHRLFENLGYVVARTGWGRDASLLSFRAGPVAGRLARQAALRLGSHWVQSMDDSAEHAQMDQNSITYFSKGTYWLSPPGYGARQSARHATLVIDGRQQVKDCRLNPTLVRAEFTDDYVYLLGDASTAYPGEVGLQRFHRHLVWLKPDVLVVCDDVRAERPATVEWRMHPYRTLPPPDAEGKSIILRASEEADAPTLEVRFLLPEKLSLIGSTKEAIPEELKQRKSRNRLLGTAYSVAKTEVASERCVFLVLVADGEAQMRAAPLKVEGGAGVLLERGADRSAIIFSFEPLDSYRERFLSYTLPAGKLDRHLVVSLPALQYVDVTRAVNEDGSLSISISPGKEMQTSSEGTLSLVE